MSQYSDDQSRRLAGLARHGIGATPGSDAVDQEGAARWLLDSWRRRNTPRAG